MTETRKITDCGLSIIATRMRKIATLERWVVTFGPMGSPVRATAEVAFCRKTGKAMTDRCDAPAKAITALEKALENNL